MSRPPARTRGLKHIHETDQTPNAESRPPARTRGLKRLICPKCGAEFVASSREDAWIETIGRDTKMTGYLVASSREDAWIETCGVRQCVQEVLSRPPARTRGLKLDKQLWSVNHGVASSREDAWIETGGIPPDSSPPWSRPPARTRGLKLAAHLPAGRPESRVLPRGRVD